MTAIAAQAELRRGSPGAVFADTGPRRRPTAFERTLVPLRFFLQRGLNIERTSSSRC